jgi:MerR family transcriptional regulator, redox-sensitive transcriptional activator SoxR
MSTFVTPATADEDRFDWHADGLTVGEVAERMRTAASKVRFYADHGLLPHRRTSGNQRRFYPDVLCRVAMIQVSQQVGLTLTQIRDALEELPPRQAPTEQDWRALSARLQETLHEHITDLFGLLDQLANDVAKPQSSR